MKAVLAYFQGKFNNCAFEAQGAGKYKVNLSDHVNELEGSFVAEFDANMIMIDVQADTGMKPVKKVAVPKPLP